MSALDDAVKALPSGSPNEWAAKAADNVDLVVDLVHDKAIRPIILAARVVVFGLLIAVMAIVLTVLLSIGLVRLLDVYAFSGRVWASYYLISFVFVALGSIAWVLRTPREAGHQ